LLQQFTVDRKQLELAVRRLTWVPGANNSVDIFAQARGDDTLTDLENEGVFERISEDDVRGLGRERAEYFNTFRVRRRIIVALRFLINDMRKLPGRKALVIFSDGLGINPVLQRPLRLLVDYANRSGIVIHTIDARGLVNPDFIGPGETPTEEQRDSLRQARAGALFQSQGGLSYLAEQTGGTFTVNSNDVGKGLRRAFEEQRGYYLIGYRPSENSFKGGVNGFRKLDVRVKRPGLRVRTRKGFIGVTDDVLNVPERPSTGDSQLYAALVSPVPSNDVPLRLTAISGQDDKGNSFLRALLHIDAQTISFPDDANGWKRMTLDVVGVTLGQNGGVVNEFTRTHTVRVGPETLAIVQQNGLIYSADVPVKSSGAYQFRIVVRDANSKRFGTAGQFIEIPDLKKSVLALSGIVLTEASSKGKPGLPPAVPVEAALSPVQFSSDPAVRRFSPGAALSYAHLIYNARAVARTGKPQITTQVRLFHDGKEVFTGPEAVFDPDDQKDTARLSNDGVVQLSPNAASGDYSLQIVVKDHSTGKNPRVATQWIDFEVVE
jgi:VWFA-related protein